MSPIDVAKREPNPKEGVRVGRVTDRKVRERVRDSGRSTENGAVKGTRSEEDGQRSRELEPVA